MIKIILFQQNNTNYKHYFLSRSEDTTIHNVFSLLQKKVQRQQHN